MGYPMTVERVVSRNRLDRNRLALMDDLRRLAEDSAQGALDDVRAKVEALLIGSDGTYADSRVWDEAITNVLDVLRALQDRGADR